MSRELHEIRRKVAMAQKQHVVNEHERARAHQEKIINSASEQKQKYKSGIERSVQAEKRTALCISAAKIAAAGCICAFSVILVSKAVAAPTSNFSVTIKADEKYSRIAIEKAERIFRAFRNKDSSELKALAGRLDEFGMQDCESVIGRFTAFPDFKQASVQSPKTDPDMYYVSVPPTDGIRAQLVFRMINGNIVFEGIGLNA